MNCKPGDLAVVRSNYQDRIMVGMPVTVVRKSRGERVKAKDNTHTRGFSSSDESWLCDGPSLLLPRLIADEFLQPIGAQSEDAQDETLSWIPVPTKETA